jgi:hypothetical protein
MRLIRLRIYDLIALQQSASIPRLSDYAVRLYVTILTAWTTSLYVDAPTLEAHRLSFSCGGFRVAVFLLGGSLKVAVLSSTGSLSGMSGGAAFSPFDCTMGTVEVGRTFRTQLRQGGGSFAIVNGRLVVETGTTETPYMRLL